MPFFATDYLRSISGLSFFDNVNQRYVGRRAVTDTDITARTPRVMQLMDGSAAAPVTDNVSATLIVSRYSAMTVSEDANAAGWFSNNDFGTLTQPVAVHGDATQFNQGDACAGYFQGIIDAGATLSGHTPVGIALFGDAIINLPGADGEGFNPILQMFSSRGGATRTAGIFAQVGYPGLATPNANVTFTAANDQVTWTAHPMKAGYTLRFDAGGGGLGAPLLPGVDYFVKAVIDANNFTLSATLGGATIDITTNGTPPNVARAFFVGGSAYNVETANTLYSRFVYGYKTEAGSVDVSSIRIEDSAPLVFDIHGTHTDVLDFTQLTLAVPATGNLIKFPALQTYVPTVTGPTGTATGAFLVLGKMLFLEITITVTAGAGAPLVTLPNAYTSKRNQVIVGRENAVTGKEVQCLFGTGSNTGTSVLYDNTSPNAGGTGTIIITGWIEIT